MTTYHADTVIRRANVITIDPALPRASAVAMRDGRFIGVGSDSDVEMLIGPNTKYWIWRARRRCPGSLTRTSTCSASGTRHVMAADCSLPTVADIKDALRERVAKTPAGEWVQGFKFDDTKTAENRFLRREDLDAVSTDHPILVSHRAGHVYFGNTLALERAGYNDESPDPPGGRLGRNPDTGRLDGVIYERAADDLREHQLPVESAETRREGLRVICEMLNRAGLTSVHDARGNRLRTGHLPGRPRRRRPKPAGVRHHVVPLLPGAARRRHQVRHGRRPPAHRRHQDGGRRSNSIADGLPVGALCRQLLRPRYPDHDRRRDHGECPANARSPVSRCVSTPTATPR